MHGGVYFDPSEPPYLPGVFSQCAVARPDLVRPPDEPPSPSHPRGWWHVRDDECVWSQSHHRSLGYAWTLEDVETCELELFMSLAWHLVDAHAIWEPVIERRAAQRFADSVER